MGEASSVIFHRTKYFLSPQLDLYKNIRNKVISKEIPTFVLDYGCATGVGTLALLDSGNKSNVVDGIDYDPEAIKFANDVFGHLIKFKRDNWCKKRNVKEWEYNLVTCIEVIEHVKDPNRLLQQFKRSLVTGGTLICSTLNHYSQYRKNDLHCNKYTAQSFKKLLSKYFDNVLLTDYTLSIELENNSTVTPIVAICRG